MVNWWFYNLSNVQALINPSSSLVANPYLRRTILQPAISIGKHQSFAIFILWFIYSPPHQFNGVNIIATGTTIITAVLYSIPRMSSALHHEIIHHSLFFSPYFLRSRVPIFSPFSYVPIIGPNVFEEGGVASPFSCFFSQPNSTLNVRNKEPIIV